MLPSKISPTTGCQLMDFIDGHAFVLRRIIIFVLAHSSCWHVATERDSERQIGQRAREFIRNNIGTRKLGTEPVLNNRTIPVLNDEGSS